MERKVILVVDDHRLIADTLAIILRAEGYDARAFHRPEDVLDEVEALRPSAMVSDYRMGSMDGASLAEAVLALCPDCKIVLMSGSCRLDELSAERGFDFLAKPVETSELLAILKSKIDPQGYQVPA